jgi:hypothetical protein
MRENLILGVASMAIAAAIATVPSKTHAQLAYGGMVGGYGSGGMMGPGYGYGMMGNYGPGMMGGCPMMGATADGKISTFAEGRIAFLKAELGITDAQKSAWDAYTVTINGNLQSMQGMWQTMKTVVEAKTPADRLDAQIAAMESRVAVLKEVKPALEKLYAALSDEQKKKAEEVLTGMGCMM